MIVNDIGVAPYTMEKAARAAKKRNKKEEQKAPLLALVGDVRVWSPEDVYTQATQIGRSLEDTLKGMRERDEARIVELENAIAKAISPEAFDSWKAIKRVSPPDLSYTCEWLFKFLVEEDPPTAWQLCLHAKSDRHTFLGLSYKNCPVCKKPLDQRDGLFWFASYLLDKKHKMGYLFENARHILDEAEISCFIELCNRLAYEMKSPTGEEIESMLAEEHLRKDGANDEPLFSKAGPRQCSLNLAEELDSTTH